MDRGHRVSLIASSRLDHVQEWLRSPAYTRHADTGAFSTCVQHKGDTMFVPVGWAHATLNLVDTLAVAQEFCLGGRALDAPGAQGTDAQDAGFRKLFGKTGGPSILACMMLAT